MKISGSKETALRRVFILSALLLALFTAIAGAQETKQFSLGLGMELNNNTRRGVAMGGSGYFAYDILKALEAGIIVGIDYDFNKITVLEPELTGRWYFYNINENSLFTQADLGASLIFEKGENRARFLGGITLGMRFPLGDLYVEPYVRGGYPFIWGTGLRAGLRF
jgi:hypothetical protein